MTPSAPPKPKREVKISYSPWAAKVEGRGIVGQAAIHASKAKYRVVMAGRQSGKTLVGIAEICIAALEDRRICWWVSPNYKVKPRAWRGILDFLPAEVIEKKNETESYVRLVNGSEIWVKSADASDSLVSESLDFAVCDEAGQWKESAWYQGISPMFAARAAARALLIGTPRGKNWFHRTWLKGRIGSEKDPEYDAFHWKSEDSPYVSRSFLEEQKRNIPRDTYLQEYEADPLDNAAAVFRNFRQCVRTMPAEVDGFMCLGVDVARKRDFTAIVAMNGRRQVTEVQEFQGDWPEQESRIVATSFRNNFARGIVDATGEGDVVVAHLREKGMQVEDFIISSQSKERLIRNLVIDFEQSQISIPGHERLISQLDAYAYEYDEDSRKLKYGAPEGQNDDLVIALALASWGQRGVPAFLAREQMTSYMGGGKGRRTSYMGGRR